MLRTFLFISFIAFCAAKIKVTTVCEHKTAMGVSPHWDVERQSLFYTDMFGSEYDVLRYDWVEKKLYKATVPIDLSPKVVSFILPVKGTNDTFLIGVASRKTMTIRWDGISTTVEIIDDNLFAVEQQSQFANNYWEIGRADIKGRFYGATFRGTGCTPTSFPYGEFYQYTKEQGVKLLQSYSAENVPSGIEWDTNKNKLYFAHLCIGTMVAYDWDPVTGDISNSSTTVFEQDIGNEGSNPASGLAVDSNGMLFTGQYNHSSVWQIDPVKKKKIQEIQLPTKVPADVTFGGPNLDVLFVTTVSVPLDLATGEPTGQTVDNNAGALLFIEGIAQSKGYADNDVDVSTN